MNLHIPPELLITENQKKAIEEMAPHVDPTCFEAVSAFLEIVHQAK